jgi:hypothetical protein
MTTNDTQMAVKRVTALVYGHVSVPRGNEGDELATTGEAVWHATAQITGKRCMCADCAKNRGER